MTINIQVTTGSEDQLATALNSIETDRDRDATAIKKRAKVLQKEAREKGDNVYRGQAGYLDYLGKEDTSGMRQNSILNSMSL